MSKKDGDGVALVTGAARGIGLAVCQGLARDGYSVVACDVDPTVNDVYARFVSNEVGYRSGYARQVDITDTDAFDALVAETVEGMGSVDILVNCAGVFPGMVRVVDLTRADLARTMSVNFEGTVFCCRSVARHMMENRRGAIVNVGNRLYERGFPNWSSFAVAGAALVAFTRTMALELAPYGVRANCVAPAFIQTTQLRKWLEQAAADRDQTLEEWEARQRALIPMNRFGEPEEAAEAVIFLASSRSSFMTGQVLWVDGGRGLQ